MKPYEPLSKEILEKQLRPLSSYSPTLVGSRFFEVHTENSDFDYIIQQPSGLFTKGRLRRKLTKYQDSVIN